MHPLTGLVDGDEVLDRIQHTERLLSQDNPIPRALEAHLDIANRDRARLLAELEWWRRRPALPTPTITEESTVADLATSVARLVRDHMVVHPSVTNMALPAAVSVAWALTLLRPSLTVGVAHGDVAGHEHWWCEVLNLWVDPARHIVGDGGALVVPRGNPDYDLYDVSGARWTRESVSSAAERVLDDSAAADLWAVPLVLSVQNLHAAP